MLSSDDVVVLSLELTIEKHGIRVGSLAQAGDAPSKIPLFHSLSIEHEHRSVSHAYLGTKSKNVC
jgi:hypothetical protein